jgi:hypothetical protein
MAPQRRSRGDGTLTGGLGDVNPALLSTSVTQSTTDTTTSIAVQTPVTVVAGRGSSDIMEILKIFWYFDGEPALLAGTNTAIVGYLSTKNFGTTAPGLKAGDALVFSSAGQFTQVTAATVAGEFNQMSTTPIVQDLTDGAGHGFLVATSNIFLQAVSTATSATNTIRVKILYRLKKVTEGQLTGLLLSQNQG